MDLLTTFGTRRTPQNRPAREDQVKNRAGGYGFQVSDQDRLMRFLTLGTEGGTLYVGAQDLTVENAQTVLRMAQAGGATHRTLVDTIVEVSTSGRAPKQNPAIFALAIAASHGGPDETRYALDQLSRVARIGTHLFLFAKYVEQFRGWGRQLRRAVGDWYTGKSVDKLAYQVVKYRQREGWSHRDLLRLSHPEADTGDRGAVFDFAVNGSTDPDQDNAIPMVMQGFQLAQDPANAVSLPSIIHRYGLSWEMLPTDALGRADVWEALLEVGVPQTALMRQLPRLTKLGLAKRRDVIAQLTDQERLTKARVHPIAVLIAHMTYASGVSRRGASTWTPDRKVVDALDEAFYKSFGNVRTSGKRTLLALDVSGSMSMCPAGDTGLTARDASAAMALITMATEDDVDVVGYTSSATQGRLGWGFMRNDAVTPLSISPRQRLRDVIRDISGLPFGGTDCSLPARWARENGEDYGAIIHYTDSETWAGGSHPFQELERYREHVGHDVAQVVVGMTATDASIADPNDQRSLDVAGFDASVPNLVADFVRGDA